MGFCLQGLVIFLAYLSNSQCSPPGGPHPCVAPSPTGAGAAPLGKSDACLATSRNDAPPTHLASSPRPLGVFQLVGFVYACYVVSVFTEEEDSCKCMAGRPPQKPIRDAAQPCPARQRGRERGAEGWPPRWCLRVPLLCCGLPETRPLDGSPCPQGSLHEQRGGWSSHLRRHEEGPQAVGTRCQLTPRPAGLRAPV